MAENEMDKTVKLTSDSDKTVKLIPETDKTIKLTPDLDKTVKLIPDSSSPAPQKPMVPPLAPPPPPAKQKKSKKELMIGALVGLILAGCWLFLPTWFKNNALKLSKEGKHAEAAKQLQWALYLFPMDTPSYLLWFGRELRMVKDFARSQEILEKLLQKKPEHLAGQRELAQTFHGAGQKEKALELFQKVLGQKADDFEVLKWTGSLAFELKKFDLAAATYEKYVQAGIAVAEDYFQLGASYFELEKLEQSREALKLAWEKNNQLKGVAKLLGKIHLLQENYREAANHLKAELSLSPEDEGLAEEFAQACLEGGKILIVEKNLKDAQKLLEDGLAVPTKHASVLHYQLAVVLAKSGKKKDALNHLKKAVASDASLKKQALKETAFSNYRKLPEFLKIIR